MCVFVGFDLPARLNNLKEYLRKIIEPDDDLLAQMLSKGVLTHEKMVKIVKLPTEYDKIDELLTWLINDYKDDSETIFELLGGAGQKHVVNYIIADGSMFCAFRPYFSQVDYIVKCSVRLFVCFSHPRRI
jgi:hypothetical protein